MSGQETLVRPLRSIPVIPALRSSCATIGNGRSRMPSIQLNTVVVAPNPQSQAKYTSRKNGSAQESDNLPEKPAFSERWPLASLRGWGNTTGQGF
jgi:hypothetical protein